MKISKLFGVGLALFGWVGGCSEQAVDGDGESHFLAECSELSRCPGKMDCLCGVCTQACRANADCGDFGASATCVQPSTCSVPVCGVACRANADCAAFGASACVRGVCSADPGDGGVRAPADRGDSSAPDSSAHGTGGGRDAEVDAGGRPGTGGDAAADGPAEECCLAGAVEWSDLAPAYSNSRKLTGCANYARTDQDFSCDALLPSCGEGGIDTTDVDRLLVRADVRNGFAADRNYGRLTDGGFAITFGGHRVVIRYPCAGWLDCVDAPDGIQLLADLLRRIDVQELGRGSCRPEARCFLPTDHGPCGEDGFARFGYDTASGTCKLFQYGGCGGNENRFDTLEDCQATCRFDACHAGSHRELGVGDAGEGPLPCTLIADGVTCFLDPVAACGCACERAGNDGAACQIHAADAGTFGAAFVSCGAP